MLKLSYCSVHKYICSVTNIVPLNNYFLVISWESILPFIMPFRHIILTIPTIIAFTLRIVRKMTCSFSSGFYKQSFKTNWAEECIALNSVIDRYSLLLFIKCYIHSSCPPLLFCFFTIILYHLLCNWIRFALYPFTFIIVPYFC